MRQRPRVLIKLTIITRVFHIVIQLFDTVKCRWSSLNFFKACKPLQGIWRDHDPELDSVHFREGKLIASNTSGIRSVCFDQRTGKWIASGRENGKNVNLGHFDTAAEAECVRRAFVEEKYRQPALQRVAASFTPAEAFGDYFQRIEKTE